MKIILFSCVFTILVLKISGHVLGQSANTRIIYGEPTTIEEHPYQASIEVYGNHHNCGGTILSPNVIITAAQCTVYMSLRFIQVRAGTTERETGGVVRKIEKYYVHELYGLEMGADYDVSLIVLKEPLPLSSKIQPITLPEESEYLNVTEMTTVTGWGELEQGSYEMPNILHKVSIPVVGQQICKYNYYSGVTDRMLCAGYLEEGGKGACGGDIGGPLVAHNKLHGIASWGNGCAKPWYPGVYTRVPAIREWIREKVNL